jgi:uncharacterized protein YdeI (YjbR/CyaY-like superfamily)
MPKASAVKQFDVRIDAYIAKAAPFAQPILTHVRELVHKTLPDVEETIKWSMPHFMYRGIILGNMAAFKEHCSFGVWHENVQAIMKKGVEERGMGSFGKVKSLKDLPSDAKLRPLLVDAARKINAGERTKNWAGRAKKDRPAATVPPSLAAALKKNKTAAKQFEAMSPSCKREYCEWIADAKRDETREKRLATAMEWIAEGKARNWKYEKC